MPFLIGDAAKAVRRSTRTLKEWERIGLISPERTPSGYRVYSAADMNRLREIKASMDLIKPSTGSI